MNFFIIPGNPPAAYFYELWAQEILASYPRAMVKVCTYPTLTHNSESDATLDFVTQSHSAKLHDFRQKTSGPLFVLGHSLGGNFALRLMQKDHELIDRAFLIHPFLRAPTKRGKRILRTIHCVHGKTTLQNMILRSRRFLEWFSADLQRVTDSELLTCFELAGHEHLSIAHDHTPLGLTDQWHVKIEAFHTPNDTWCSPQVIGELSKHIKTHKILEPHGFITTSHHRLSVLGLILERAKSMLADRERPQQF